MYQAFISLRYLRARKTAILAVVAVTFGVATLLTVLSVMEGYIFKLKETIRGQESHLILRTRYPLGLCDIDAIGAAIESSPHVIGWSPTVETLAMYRSDRFNPCLIRGIDPTRELRVTTFGSSLFRPEEVDSILEPLLDADPEAPARGPSSPAHIANNLGREIQANAKRSPLSQDEAERLFSLEHRRELVDQLPEALRLRLLGGSRIPPSAIVVGLSLLASRELSIGQIVKLITVKPGTSDLVEGNFMVTGAYKTGNHEVDQRMVFIHNQRLATFLRTTDERSGEPCYETVRIALDDYANAAQARDDIRVAFRSLSPSTGVREAQIHTWEDYRRKFLQAVEIEKVLMGIVVSALNIFTAFITLLLLILLTIEKTRDAGILLAMGAKPSGVFSIFLLNGFIITAIGALLGIGVGSLFIAYINDIHDFIYAVTGLRLFDPEVYLFDRIPTKISALDTLVSALPSLVFGLLASLVPATFAARRDPIKAIHHE